MTIPSYFALAATTLAFATTSNAEDRTCCSQFTRPYVCDLRLRVSFDGRDWQNLKSVDTLRLGAKGRLYVEAVGIAQDGRDFPSERMKVGVTPDRSFSRFFDIEDQGGGRLLIRAGDDRGSASLRIWMPGNYNLEHELRLEIGDKSSPGAPQGDAVFIADALYEAILGRKPDAPGREQAIREIQSGGALKLASGMLHSREFRLSRSKLTPEQLLTDFYRGLLGREPDPGGMATYLPKMRKREQAEVIESLMSSREFKKRTLER